MLNTLKVPPRVADELRETLPHSWQARATALTAEELFYVHQLLQFKTKDASKCLFYLVLRLRVVRYLSCKERTLRFTDGEWRALEKIWKEKFLQFCLKERSEV